MATADSESREMNDKNETETEKRTRRPTEKGLSYDLETKYKQIGEAFKHLRTQIDAMKQMMRDGADIKFMKTEYSKWMTLYEEFLNIHDEYCAVLPTEDREEYLKDDFALKDTYLCTFKKSVENWFVQESKNQDSVSQVSTRSRRTVISHVSSSVSSARLQQEQKSAELNARVATLKHKQKLILAKQQLEYQKLQLSMEQEELDLNTEMAITEAKKKVLDNFEISNLENETQSVKRNTMACSVINEPKSFETLHATVNHDVTVKSNVNGFDINVLDTNVNCGDTIVKNSEAKECSNLNANAECFIPDTNCNVVNFDTSGNRYDNDLFPGNTPTVKPSEDIILSVVRHLKKPSPDLKKFNGDPMEYRKFIRQFNTRIVVNCDDDSEKMTYLEQFTTGEANRIVACFSCLSDGTGYNKVLVELEDRYGNPETIANAFVQKALNWNFIKPDNPKGLDDFAIFLLECENAVKGISAVRVLEFSENMKQLISKLPFHCHEKWRGIVQRTKSHGENISFHQLVEFVKQEAKKANDPTFGRIALMANFPNTKPNQKQRPRGTFATSEVIDSGEKLSANYAKEPYSMSYSPKWNTKTHAFSKPCIYCKHANHAMERCKVLSALSYEQKSSELKVMGLCYGCLRRGHMKKDCRSIATCEHCNGNHPTVLHADERPIFTNDRTRSGQQVVNKTASEKVCSYAGLGAVDCALAIVPVNVKRKNGLKVVQAYAFLDPGSSVTFCTQSLMHHLGAKGRKMSITLDTIGEPYSMKTYGVEDLQICDIDMENTIDLPRVYTKSEMPVSKSYLPTKDDINRWDHLRDISFPNIDAEICLLIGNNVPDAYTPMECRTGPRGTPHATKTRIGWIPWNIVKSDNNSANRFTVNRIELKAINESEETDKLDQLVRKSINMDFPEQISDDIKSYSQDDKRFIGKVENSIQLISGHYQICLPLKDDNVRLPDNSAQALQRLRSLQRKMQNLPKFHADYVDFMQKVIDKGFAEPVPKGELNRNDGRSWYIPHHGIYHPQKPEKIRIVFDCSATYHGVSLNNQLLPGPDLTNTLLGVLLRFRKEQVAIQGDIESMFYQVRVAKDDCDCLRFFWWPNGDLKLSPQVYRMRVHLFGAVSSPSCSNTALRQTAKDNMDSFDSITTETLLKSFYVDDCLTSTNTEDEAVALIDSVSSLCKRGGFHVTKWICNRPSVVESIPQEERSKDIVNLDLTKEDLPSQRALGVHWSVQDDELGFKIAPKQLPATRRSILSIVSSVFDPLGLAAPFILTAKQLLQDLCRRKLDWDEAISGSDLKKWEKWLNELRSLESFRLPRCYKPESFGEIVSLQLHTFSDASDVGYGVVSYLRLLNDQGEIYTSMLLGKARVAPLKKFSTPRMELTAAVIAVRLTNRLVKELDYPIDKNTDVFLWTDSMAVLRYIANESTRFQTFVANRVTVIREGSNVHQWGYVNTVINPADAASRGQGIQKFLQNRLWREGPAFLRKPKSEWPSIDNLSDNLLDNDPEVKRLVCVTLPQEQTFLDMLVGKFSKWAQLKNCVAKLLIYKKNLATWAQSRKNLESTASDGVLPNGNTIETEMNIRKLALLKASKERLASFNVSLSMTESAERLLVQQAQQSYFKNEIQSLNLERKVTLKASSITKLDPFMEDGFLKVGGRLARSDIPHSAKHQILIPKESPLSKLIAEDAHTTVGHLGVNSTMADVRQKFWIIGARSVIKSIVSKCITCRKYQARLGEQKMADLPKERLCADVPPFTNVDTDYFGPIEVKRGRTSLKRYRVIFTCMSSRAVHLELASSLNTDSCINALRRFIARRGQVKHIRSDNGTNFVGTNRELKEEINKWNQQKIMDTLLQKGIVWEFNPPAASHFGGVWERIIRLVRKVLHGLLKEQTLRLDDEGLQTLLCEVEAILNQRPISELSDDPNDLEAITPNHLLLLQNGGGLPPGLFQKHDNYARRRWRQVQYLADLFWKRWTKEYLPLLQQRQKWNKSRRNVKIGDLVLLAENAPRSSWAMGRVVDVYPDRKGFVRSVKVRTKSGEVLRPIDKLCVLMEFD